MELPVMERVRKTSDEIAKEALAQIEKEKSSQKTEEVKKEADKASQTEGKAETKGAAEADKTAETKKTEETASAVKAAEDAAKKTAETKPEPKPDKVAERKTEIQKEIDSLIAQKKALENELGDVSQIKTRLQQMEKELAEVKKPKQEVDQTTVLKKAEQDRITKYLAEDAEKPREQRREMKKEELEDWFLEDQVAATEWINDRAVRRAEERTVDKQKVQAQGKASEFISNQEKSREKLIAKFPQVQVATRAKELMAQGKTGPEVHQILMEENKYYKLCHEIATSDPKYVESENGPELVMQEMEKRLSSSGEKGKTFTAEEVERIKAEAVEAERQRIEGLDTGVTSTTRRGETKPLSDFEKRELEIAKKAGMTEEDLRKAKERRAKIMGADRYREPEDK